MIGLANVYKVSKAWSVVVHKLKQKKRQKSKNFLSENHLSYVLFALSFLR